MRYKTNKKIELVFLKHPNCKRNSSNYLKRNLLPPRPLGVGSWCHPLPCQRPKNAWITSAAPIALEDLDFSLHTVAKREQMSPRQFFPKGPQKVAAATDFSHAFQALLRMREFPSFLHRPSRISTHRAELAWSAPHRESMRTDLIYINQHITHFLALPLTAVTWAHC